MPLLLEMSSGNLVAETHESQWQQAFCYAAFPEQSWTIMRTTLKGLSQVSSMHSTLGPRKSRKLRTVPTKMTADAPLRIANGGDMMHELT